MRKLQSYFSLFFLIGLVLIFVAELLLFIQNNSVLIKNKIDPFKALGIFVILFLIVLFLRIKLKINLLAGTNILSIGLSLLVLYFLRDTIPFYLFTFHYESFVIKEFIIIYYSLIVSVYSVISLIVNKKT